MPGGLLIDEPTVSRRHCIVRLAADGRCFARDVSRNGTRLDGRRMVPNLEVEFRPGQTLTVGAHTELVLEGEHAASVAPTSAAEGGTVHAPGASIATVLVGDIRNYTTLVRRASPRELQQSVSRVFDLLNRAVVKHLGTVKTVPRGRHPRVLGGQSLRRAGRGRLRRGARARLPRAGHRVGCVGLAAPRVPAPD